MSLKLKLQPGKIAKLEICLVSNGLLSVLGLNKTFINFRISIHNELSFSYCTISLFLYLVPFIKCDQIKILIVMLNYSP